VDLSLVAEEDGCRDDHSKNNSEAGSDEENGEVMAVDGYVERMKNAQMVTNSICQYEHVDCTVKHKLLQGYTLLGLDKKNL